MTCVSLQKYRKCHSSSTLQPGGRAHRLRKTLPVFCFLFLLHFRFHCFFNFTKINLKFASIAEISIAVTCNLLNIQLSTVSLPLPRNCTPCERKRWPDRRRIGLWVVPNRQLQENNLPLAKFPHLFLEAVAPHQDKVDLGQRREIE